MSEDSHVHDDDDLTRISTTTTTRMIGPLRNWGRPCLYSGLNHLVINGDLRLAWDIHGVSY